jgi:hypothetical protein
MLLKGGSANSASSHSLGLASSFGILAPQLASTQVPVQPSTNVLDGASWLPQVHESTNFHLYQNLIGSDWSRPDPR